jgi:hypothetical protein
MRVVSEVSRVSVDPRAFPALRAHHGCMPERSR